MHREDAVLHVELAAYRAAPSGRSQVPVPDLTDITELANAAAAPDRACDEAADAPSWTLNLLLN